MHFGGRLIANTARSVELLESGRELVLEAMASDVVRVEKKPSKIAGKFCTQLNQLFVTKNVDSIPRIDGEKLRVRGGTLLLA